MDNYHNKDLGQKGEHLALKIYNNSGYKLVYKNWRYSRLGEIDLIMQRNDLLVFCEVKTRSNNIDSPSKAVTKQKQNKIIKLSKIFLMKFPQYSVYNIRYDVCQIIKKQENKFFVEIIADAFTA